MDATTLIPPQSKRARRIWRGSVQSCRTLKLLPDPRRGQGKRYEFALLVCLLLLAKLAGQSTLSGATEWIRHWAETKTDALSDDLLSDVGPHQYAGPR